VLQMANHIASCTNMLVGYWILQQGVLPNDCTAATHIDIVAYMRM
jgi:hypothetical protein